MAAVSSVVNYRKIEQWKGNILNLLFNKNICSVCLVNGEDLMHLDEVYHVENEDFSVDCSLRNILEFTFGNHVTELLPSSHFCHKCVTVMLKSYLFLKKIKYNHHFLQKHFDIISKQMKHNSDNEVKQNHKYYLRVDNVASLKVPETVIKTEKYQELKYSARKIIYCEINDFVHSEIDTKVNRNTKYECPFCGFRTNIFELSKKHYVTQHINQSLFNCISCMLNFKTLNNLMDHRNSFHSQNLVYCVTCKIILHGISNTEHDKTDHSNNVFDVCEASGELDTVNEDHLVHRTKESNEQSECEYCSKVFCSISTLNMHIKKFHHKQQDSKNIIYRCTMCTEDFKYRADYLKHITTHPVDSKHICRMCNEGFLSKNNYYSHIRKHQIKYDKDCHICFKKYTKHTISRHIRSHLRNVNDALTDSEALEKNTMCDVCGALLTNEKSLFKHSEKHKEETQCPHCKKLVNNVLYSRHIRTHTNTDPKLKACTECDYTTRFSICLEGHVNRHHLKTRPYQCEICSKRFYSDYTLKGHKYTHTDNRPECCCEVCGKKFISKRALMLHMRLHTGERPYPCDLCELSFLSASRRREHRIRKHFEPSVECDICMKKLYTQRDLRRHVGDCHGGEPKRKKQRNIGGVLKAV